MKPYLSYKNSGVEWIGKIPSHWDKIKTNLISENLDFKRIPLNSQQREKMKGNVPYWGSNGIIDYINDFIFNEELVLVGEDGSPFFERFRDVSFFINGMVWINNHIHVLRTKSNILPLTVLSNAREFSENNDTIITGVSPIKSLIKISDSISFCL